MNFMPRDSSPNEGIRKAIPVRTVTAQGLITTYRYRIVFGIRFRWPRGRPPEMSLFASINPIKPGAPANDAKTGRRDFDPYGDYAFKVQIEGVTDDKLTAHFQKFDGFDMEIETIEYKTGEDAHAHKRNGVPKYSTIKLSKGFIKNKKLWDWCEQTAKGKLERKNVTITVIGEDRDDKTALAQFNFIGCWPSKWSGLRLDGKGSGTMVEEIELVVDYVENKSS
jgi:phage tail-like protein